MMAIFKAISREAAYISSVARTFYRMRHVKPDSKITICQIVEGFAAKTPRAPAIHYLERTISYRELDEAANRTARWATSQGVKKGDVVALLMENRPEFIMTWLGLLKTGAIVAMVNTNLRGAALAHCIAIAKARHLVLGSELAAPYAEASAGLESPPAVWVTGEASAAPNGAHDLDAALAQQSSDAVPHPGTICDDKAFYIFTSGTTGLPKAANISHMRMLFMMYGFAGALASRASDCMYIPLPLYHSSGGICAVGVALTAGGSMVIRRKFSVQEFWDDVSKYRVTLFQYIGELCRYLLNAPPHPLERAHHMRAITGNGLRPEIWPAFQARFKIPKIVEFYGATEGNVSMLNYDGKIGAVGRIPPYMRKMMKTRIVRFDIEHEIPVRGPDGFCIECADGETGEAIGQITQEPGQNFEGYTKKEDTQKKILRDAFEKGDAWFRTGDLMKQDAHGYFYFVDRIGDTFRWKGENVATSEVAEALSVVPGVKEANVYGVAVPGTDGRAGMAALVTSAQFAPEKLAEALANNLPEYAKPVFLRLQPELEVTGTFKQRKVELVKDGFDPHAITDPIYMRDPETGQYEMLSDERYRAVMESRVKL